MLEFSFPGVRKKPRNYRERLSYVNLETADPAIVVKQFPDLQDLHFLASGQLLYALLDLTLISLIANNFTAQKHPFGNGALMPVISGSFATGKPAFWCQKDKDQTDHTKKIPLPGVTRVIPEEYLLQCGRQASHVFKLASKQPLESWLAGRLILPKTVIPLEQENELLVRERNAD